MRRLSKCFADNFLPDSQESVNFEDVSGFPAGCIFYFCDIIMAKDKHTAVAKTNVARLLDKAKVHYELIPYEVDENDLAADHVARQLGGGYKPRVQNSGA